MEGARVIVGDLDGYGVESGARRGGLDIFSHGSLAWGSFFSLTVKGLITPLCQGLGIATIL